jgi:micrococcal nuclease
MRNCFAHYNLFAAILIGLVVFSIATSCGASEETCIRARLIYVIDGDTFRAHIDGVKSPDSYGYRIRVAEIDTAELKGRCENETNLARQARAAAKKILRTARVIELSDLRLDKYGRIVASVWINGQNFGALMLESGLAQEFNRWTPKKWCS